MTEQEIDDKITEWHSSDSQLTIYEYLGMTWEQYSHFVLHSEVPNV